MKYNALIEMLKSMHEDSQICFASEDEKKYPNGLYGIEVTQLRDGIILSCGDEGVGYDPSNFISDLSYETDKFDAPKSDDILFFDGIKLCDFTIDCEFDNSKDGFTSCYSLNLREMNERESK